MRAKSCRGPNLVGYDRAPGPRRAFFSSSHGKWEPIVIGYGRGKEVVGMFNASFQYFHVKHRFDSRNLKPSLARALLDGRARAMTGNYSSLFSE